MQARAGQSLTLCQICFEFHEELAILFTFMLFWRPGLSSFADRRSPDLTSETNLNAAPPHHNHVEWSKIQVGDTSDYGESSTEVPIFFPSIFSAVRAFQSPKMRNPQLPHITLCQSHLLLCDDFKNRLAH